MSTNDPPESSRGRPDGPADHPLMAGFACPSCRHTQVRLATEAERFLYLRCDRCAQVWSHPERRQRVRRRGGALS